MSKPVLPLIALVNSKSGGQDGPKLIRKLQACMPKENVFDLAEGGPSAALAKCKTQRTRILVCGGDGTVAWVLSEIKKSTFEERLRPVVAILPLGTANDLSRTLKWGPGWTGEKITSILPHIDKASVVLMDQWNVVCTSANDEKTYIMSNYFSVGSDAEVALKFHKKREEKPTLFKNRARNKGWYAKFALSTFLRAQPLSSAVEIELDGVKLEIASKISIILVLNLPSYASGMNPWGVPKSKKYMQPSIDDGKFEVVGIKGLFHAGGIQMGMIKGKRLGQGHNLTIRLNKAIAAQVDGEPWLQDPAIIRLTHAGPALMLANSPPVHIERLPVQRTISVSSSLTAESATPASSSSVASKAPSIRAEVTRTMSASAINYGPVPVAKRKRNRHYCEICHHEFFLPYMLQNHVAKGCCSVEYAPDTIEGTPTSSSSSPPTSLLPKSPSKSFSPLSSSSPLSPSKSPSSFSATDSSPAAAISLGKENTEVSQENISHPTEGDKEKGKEDSLPSPTAHLQADVHNSEILSKPMTVHNEVTVEQQPSAAIIHEKDIAFVVKKEDSTTATGENSYTTLETQRTVADVSSEKDAPSDTCTANAAEGTVDTITTHNAHTSEDAVIEVETNQVAANGLHVSKCAVIEAVGTTAIITTAHTSNDSVDVLAENTASSDAATGHTEVGSDDNADTNNFSEEGSTAPTQPSNKDDRDTADLENNDDGSASLPKTVGKIPKQEVVWPVFQQRMRA